MIMNCNDCEDWNGTGYWRVGKGIAYSPEWKNTPISNYYEMIYKALEQSDESKNS